MASTITGETILQTVLARSKVGLTMLNANIGSIAAGSVTAVFYLRNGQHSSNHYFTRNAGLYRPGNATGVADYWRKAGELTPSTGALAIDANWADTTLGTENIYIFFDGFTPQDFLLALNQGMQLCYVENSEPLSAKPNGTTAGDNGFQSSATTAYTESDADAGPATTFSKITTDASDNVWGASIASGRVLNAAANGYIRQRWNVTRGEQLYVAALSRADVGEAKLVPYDLTNSAELTTPVAHTEESWQFMWQQLTAASTTEVLEMRYQGVGTTDDIYWGGKWVYRTQNRRIALDSKWDTTYKMPELVYGRFHGNGNSNGCVDALSLDLEVIPRTDYDFDIQRPGANPNWVQFHTNKWFNGPIWIQGRRALGDLTTFSLALSETTAGDLDLIESATRVCMFRDGGPCSHVPDAQLLWLAADKDFKAASAQMVEQTPAKRRARPYWPSMAS